MSLSISTATTHLVDNLVRDEFRLRLADLVSVAATQVNVQHHHQIQIPADQDGPAYQALQDQLRVIRDHGTHIRYIYTMRQQSDGQVIFVIDAEENAADFSALGDIYPDVTPELLAAFQAPPTSRSRFVTERFYTDAWGTWMSAYAPLYLPDGRVDAVLGMDVSAQGILENERRYHFAIWGACTALMLLLLPLAYVIAQRIRRPLSALEADMQRVRDFNLESSPSIASNIIEINSMARQLKKMKSGLRSFQKYVPAELVRRLVAQGVDAEIGGTQQNLTIFMSDVEGFTCLSERLPPDDLVRHLAEYLTVVTDSLMTTGATVDQYIGDAVLAFWNAPEPTEDHAHRACQAALESHRRIAALNQRWQSEGLSVNFKTRIGINTGNVIVGNIGSSNRMSYTIIGDQVNLVSRLEAANKFYGTATLLSESTHRAIEGQFITRLIDQLVAYGKSVPIRVYELLGHPGEVPEALLALAQGYEQAFALYQQRNFAQAISLLALQVHDHPSQVLLERCQRYLSEPPPADWDGSFTFTSK